jgi:hypothetical protein
MTKKVEKTKKNLFLVDIHFVGDKSLHGEGNTILEAIESITAPVKVFSKGTIRVTDGTLVMQETWMPKRMRRVFRPLSQRFVAKELEYLMK